MEKVENDTEEGNKKERREGPRVLDCDASCLKTRLIVKGGACSREVQRDENKIEL